MRKPNRRPRPAAALLRRNPSQLARIVPRLSPEALHVLIKDHGLEGCGGLVAHATPEQLQRVLDLDLWRPSHAGLDPQLDADRFVAWLEMLVEGGAVLALQTLAKMDEGIVAAAVAQHVRVFDRATIELGDEGCGSEIGGYVLKPKRDDSWATVAAFLQMLAGEGPDLFHRVMRGCRHLSNSRPELDGLDHLLTRADQVMFNLTMARGERLEQQGYATPGDARAFLQMARDVPRRAATPPAPNPITDAYFRAIGVQRATRAEDLVAFLAARQPPALPVRQGSAGRSARLQAYMQFVGEIDHIVYLTRTAELAFLANTVAAGSAIQSRSFTPEEASDAAAAICNLGLEHWPDQWQTGFDLVAAFQVGWTVLYRDVCLYAAECLLHVAAELPTRDGEVQAGLHALRFDLARHWRAGVPWQGRDSMDVLLLLDQTAWAALVALIDEFPVLHAALRASSGWAKTVDPSAFEFIADGRHVAEVRAYLERLPELLREGTSRSSPCSRAAEGTRPE